MRLLSTIILTISLGLVYTAAISKDSDKPPIPFEDHGACPFECCVYRDWFARGDIKILKDRKEGSSVVFGIKKGERVTALTGVVVTTKAGKAKVLKPFVIEDKRVNQGEAVYLLTYRGEGVYTVWYQDRFAEDMDVMNNIEILNKPESVWWVKIKNQKGQIGWTNRPNDFGNMDMCG